VKPIRTYEKVWFDDAEARLCSREFSQLFDFDSLTPDNPVSWFRVPSLALARTTN
jgi:hypothetical protein